LFTFILGLRAGKDQTDRVQLKEYYRVLAAHFDSILNSIKEGTPKDWASFDSVNTKLGSKPMPLVRIMKKEGKLIEINPKLAKKAEEYELELLKFGWIYNNTYCKKIEDEAISLLKKYTKGKIIEEKNNVYSGEKKETSSFTTTLCEIMLIKELVERYKTIFTRNKNLGLCLKNEKVHNFRIYIYQEDLASISITEFLDILHERTLNLAGADEILKKRNDLIIKTEKLLLKLRKRTRDPNPFWETMGKAFLDIFS
jgi:hypothetical protein